MNLYLLLISVLLLSSLGCNPRNLPVIKESLREMDKNRTEETKKVINQNPELKELDNLCRQIPLPETFSLVAIQLSPKNSISYYFISTDDFDKSENYFREYFSKTGWESLENTYNNRRSVYKNNNLLISIQFGEIGQEANYSINCKNLAVKN